jgi:hypothetical protein
VWRQRRRLQGLVSSWGEKRAEVDQHLANWFFSFLKPNNRGKKVEGEFCIWCNQYKVFLAVKSWSESQWPR